MKQLIVASFLSIFVLSSHAQESQGEFGELSLSELSLSALNGESISVNDYRGDVVVIQFWASWCGPCEKQMSVLDDIEQNYGSSGLTVLSINVDDDSKSAKSYLAARKATMGKNITYPVLLDYERRAAEQFQVETMPATYLIDRNGNIIETFKGYWPAQQADLQRAIKHLLDKPNPDAPQVPRHVKTPEKAA